MKYGYITRHLGRKRRSRRGDGLDLIIFNNFQQNERMYDGTAGRKMGITYEGKDYLLKFPENLKEQQMENINLSYS